MWPEPQHSPPSFRRVFDFNDGKQLAVLKAVQAIHMQSRAEQESMKQTTIWTVLLCVLRLEVCTTSANNCAGWQTISLWSETAVYVAQNDKQAGQGIVGRNEYGKKKGLVMAMFYVGTLKDVGRV